MGEQSDVPGLHDLRGAWHLHARRCHWLEWPVVDGSVAVRDCAWTKIECGLFRQGADKLIQALDQDQGSPCG